MTITSSGAKCDVCGNYILGLLPDEMIHPFSVQGIDQTLHSCNKCKDIITGVGKDWTKLPEGPLRKAFEKAQGEEE